MFTRSLTFLALATTALLGVQAATTCNGHAELCDKSYSNVTFLGTHNSYAVGSSIADNQNKYVLDQLNDGIRTLQMQAHNATDGIHLCHSSCSLRDGGSLTDYLSNVTTWVQANPTEVITLIMVNSDNLPPSQFASSFDASGLSAHTYSPSAASLSISEWPTLGSLVDSGKTVVVFMDYNADFSSVPYIIDEFSNMWQDAYDVTETGWECAVNRSSGNSGSSMMMINHFLDTTYTLGSTQFWIPDTASLNVTNSESSLSSHVGNCNSIWGRNPNHILLDFYDSNGNEPFNYVAQLNAVSAPTNTVTQVQAAATGSVSASGTGTRTGASGAAQSSGGAGLARGVDVFKWTVGMGVGLVGMVAGGVWVGL